MPILYFYFMALFIFLLTFLYINIFYFLNAWAFSIYYPERLIVPLSHCEFISNWGVTHWKMELLTAPVNNAHIK